MIIEAEQHSHKLLSGLEVVPSGSRLGGDFRHDIVEHSFCLEPPLRAGKLFRGERHEALQSTFFFKIDYPRRAGGHTGRTDATKVKLGVRDIVEGVLAELLTLQSKLLPNGPEIKRRDDRVKFNFKRASNFLHRIYYYLKVDDIRLDL